MRIQEVISFAIGCLTISHKEQSGFRNDPPELPRVNLGYEIHEASVNEIYDYYDFSNIRYGQPPVDELRWKRPRTPANVTEPPLNNGTDERRCVQQAGGWFPDAGGFIKDWFNTSIRIGETEWINPPPEHIDYPDPDEQEKEAKEDCLFLDVMVPRQVYNKKDRPGFKKAPVMVWLHGGGYAVGWKSQAGSPGGLIERSRTIGNDGIIYVAMNYRLGSFGWLAGPELLRAGGTANLGFYDQHLALLWVKDNIWRFGGNPDEVTVFGESAGASSILHHITAHGGLGDAPPFQRAILQSPAFFPQPEPTQQLEAYEKLLNATGTHSLRELRGLNSTDLILANSKVVQRSNYGQFTFGPVIDGFYVPALPGVSLHEGHYHRNVDIMTAYNELEGLLFTPPYIQTNESFRAYLHSVFPAAPDSAIERIEELYPPRKPGLIGEAAARINRLAQALGDAAVNCNTHYLQSAVAEYEPNRIGRGYYFAVPGAIHSLDVFYTYYPENQPKTPKIQETEAKALQRYLVNFAKTGNPNTPAYLGLPIFPRYGEDKQAMKFGPLGITGITDPIDVERCDWWQEALYY